MEYQLLLAIFFTALLSGVFGMAGGLVLLALLAARMPLADAMVLHGAAQLVANGSRALISGRYVKLKVVAGYVLGAAAALLVCVLVRLDVGTSTALVLTGAAPFVEPLLKRIKLPSLEEPRGASFCGAVATALHLLAGTAGPLLDVFFLRTALSRHQLVATKAATQVVGHSAKVVFFMLFAAKPAHAVQLGLGQWLALAVASIAGTFAGRKLLDRLSEVWFRRGARVLVLCIGAFCIVQGIVTARW